jgi:hypothetical protein
MAIFLVVRELEYKNSISESNLLMPAMLNRSKAQIKIPKPVA